MTSLCFKSMLLVLLIIGPIATLSKFDTNVSLAEFGRLFLKSVMFCHNNKNASVTDCVKESTLLSLDTLTRSDNPVELITDTICLVKTTPSAIVNNDNNHSNENRSGKYLLSIIDEAPKQNRSLILDDLLRQALLKFADTRSINIRFPISILNVLKDAVATNHDEAVGKVYLNLCS